MSIKLSQELH